MILISELHPAQITVDALSILVTTCSTATTIPTHQVLTVAKARWRCCFCASLLPCMAGLLGFKATQQSSLSTVTAPSGASTCMKVGPCACEWPIEEPRQYPGSVSMLPDAPSCAPLHTSSNCMTGSPYPSSASDSKSKRMP